MWDAFGKSWNLESEDLSLNASPIIYLILDFLNLSFLVYIMKIPLLFLSDRRQGYWGSAEVFFMKGTMNPKKWYSISVVALFLETSAAHIVLVLLVHSKTFVSPGGHLRIGWACGIAQETGIILLFQIFGLRLEIVITLQYLLNEWTYKTNTFLFYFLGATFDPFGAPSKPSGPDLLGSFLNTVSASSDPFLQPTRSPSPTLMGKKYFIFWNRFPHDTHRYLVLKASCRCLGVGWGDAT